MKALFLVILASVFVCPAYAEITEHNYKVKKDDWTYTYRHREGTWHTEVGKKVGPISVMYRHADLIDAKENRIKFTHNIYKAKHFKLDHRIEYRHFDTKESHWRYRFILSAKHKIADNVWLWAKIQPRISLKDEKVFDARDQFGVQYKNGKLKISPFVERGATGDYKHKQIVYVTHVVYDL